MLRLETTRLGEIGFRGDEGVVPCGEQDCGVSTHQRIGRDMDILHHIVTAIAANDLDGIRSMSSSRRYTTPPVQREHAEMSQRVIPRM